MNADWRSADLRRREPEAVLAILQERHEAADDGPVDVVQEVDEREDGEQRAGRHDLPARRACRSIAGRMMRGAGASVKGGRQAPVRNVVPRPGAELDVDPAAVLGDDLLRERQPEAGAALLGREERLEDARQVLGVRCRVRSSRDRDLDARRRRRARVDTVSSPPPGHRVGGVAEQVEERLAELRLVGGDGRQLRRGRSSTVHAAARRGPRAGTRRTPATMPFTSSRSRRGRGRRAKRRYSSVIAVSRSTSLPMARRQRDRLGRRSARDLLLEELGVEADRRQRVAHLVGDDRGHLADRREALGADELLLALRRAPRHRVELAREIGDLGAAGDVDALAVVAAAPPCAPPRAGGGAAARLRTLHTVTRTPRSAPTAPRTIAASDAWPLDLLEVHGDADRART